MILSTSLCADARPRNERACAEVQETLDTLAQDSFVYLEAERGYSPLTVSAYRSDLSQLFAFIQQSGTSLEPDAITIQRARRWVVHLRREGLSSNTIARHICSLRSFWRYLLDFEIVNHDPLRQVSPPRRPERLPTYLSETELRQLLQAAAEHRVEYCAVRLASLQKLLGHSRLDTTAVYLHVGSQQLRQAVEEHPPAASADRHR